MSLGFHRGAAGTTRELRLLEAVDCRESACRGGVERASREVELLPPSHAWSPKRRGRRHVRDDQHFREPQPSGSPELQPTGSGKDSIGLVHTQLTAGNPPFGP